MAAQIQDEYLPDEVYNALLDRLIRLVEEPFEVAGTDARTIVVTTLGEEGGIWPASIMAANNSMKI